jgi:CheY-like chemotaxis protein
LSEPRKRILYAEDHQDSRELLTYVLSAYEVVPSATVAEAIALVRGGHFDLCILDYFLPDGTGIELCRQIRTFNADLPIIVLSGMGRESERQEAAGAGVQLYLLKPVDFESLAEAVARLLASTGGGIVGGKRA